MDSRMRIGNGLRGHNAGFAYLLLLISLSVMGLVAASAVSIGASTTRRQAELELLVIGEQFSAALASYRTATPGAPTARGSGPRELSDLLLDRRSGGPRRHLRKIFADPLTGKSEWGVLRHPDGTIVGIFSLATGTPIKQHGFSGVQGGFDSAKRYADWVFAAS